MESEFMPRARALVAAVPQRVWTAVAGLVLLASLGVTLVLAAGLSTWQGAVGNSPNKGNALPPGSVVTPPGSAVIVVPTPHGQRPGPAAPAHPAPVHPAQPHPVVVTVALPPAPAPVAAPVTVPVAAPPGSSTPVTATPHVTRKGGGPAGEPAKGGSGHKAKHAHKAKHPHKAKQVKHRHHGKHLGWFKSSHGKPDKHS
jgi:hypothetical protein